jgi:membrane protease YdiL (CAAX protease family)
MNWKYLDTYQFSPSALPFTLFLNLDKPFIFTVLFFFYSLTNQTSLHMGKTIARYTLISALILLAPALIASYIIFEPKWDVNIIVWAVNNFFFVCAAEEMLFRGFIQTELEKITKKPLIALIIASILFGLVHFAGGAVYVGLAMMAGLVYGISYQKTGRIIVPMTVHFLVNLLHILLFTYPALKGSL